MQTRRPPSLARARTMRSWGQRRLQKLDSNCADSFAAMAKCIDRNNHDWGACAKQKEALHYGGCTVEAEAAIELRSAVDCHLFQWVRAIHIQCERQQAGACHEFFVAGYVRSSGRRACRDAVDLGALHHGRVHRHRIVLGIPPQSMAEEIIHVINKHIVHVLRLHSGEKGGRRCNRGDDQWDRRDRGL